MRRNYDLHYFSILFKFPLVTTYYFYISKTFLNDGGEKREGSSLKRVKLEKGF